VDQREGVGRDSTSKNMKLELELIQTHMTQKTILRVEVGAVPCSRCACVAHKGHARENRGGVGKRGVQGAWLFVSVFAALIHLIL
jgi:hypothetical protein